MSERRDEIAAAIRDHQVVVVAGETGSGKTTQLPKILLELGRGVSAMIGHTQPRRIAARAVADRVAEELGVESGGLVGYQVRFTDHTSPSTLIKVMTDGILLAEIQNDPLLLRYDALIIDEAHERSLTIDFLLGYLASILARRPDLKLVITSATIDTERFAAHFAQADGTPAPVIEVSGRTYPVEVRYAPYGDDADDDRDMVQAVCDAVTELQREQPGDVLVFLSGEREIRDVADAVRGQHLPGTEVLPLFSRLSAAEQHRVFEPHEGRRVVLATNVAETSLTVPGIRYVVDTGTARMSRYSTRLKVQRLPIEPVSRASANQRAGRCGRVSEGIAVRLYTEEDFDRRPEFTEPEILRTNLASVILQMTALGLGAIEEFPFLEPPDARQIKDGIDLLRELGALEPGSPLRLTEIGGRLARLPVDPRLGRMVLEAERQGCVDEVLVIVSALSIQDVRERPVDKQAQADQAHSRFADPSSDFLSLLGLWRHLVDQQRALSGNAFRRMCREQFLHYLRIREWQDLHAQLRQACREVGMSAVRVPEFTGGVADASAVHRALVSGLLSHIGSYDQSRRDYLGARGGRWAVHPSSSLAKRPPAFAVAAELVETSRLFGRTVARIDPVDVERVAGPLVRREHSNPRWSTRRGVAVADERVTLFGVPLAVGRVVPYASIDPVEARDLFLRHALVLGEWEAPHRFLRENAQRVQEIADLEDRVRRRDLLADEQVFVDFFDERVPPGISDTRSFDRWWRTERRQQPDLLTYPRDLLTPAAPDLDEDFPRVWTFGASSTPVTVAYTFDPGTSEDGVSVEIPIAVLPQMSGDDLLWQVPGRREDVITALLRGLPKSLRTSFVPVPDTARALAETLDSREGDLLSALSRELLRRTGVSVPRDAWRPDDLPDHLRVLVRVVDDIGTQIATGRDLSDLQRELTPQVELAVTRVTQWDTAAELSGLTDFPEGGVPAALEQQVGDHVIRGFPALVDRGDSVDLRVLPSEQARDALMPGGVRRLLRLAVPLPARYVVGVLTTREKVALGAAPHADSAALVEDAHEACLRDAVARAAATPVGDPTALTAGAFIAGLPHTRAAYELCLNEATRAPGERLLDTVRQVATVLELATEARTSLDRVTSPKLAAMVTDERQHIDALLPAGFIAHAGSDRLPDLTRYLRAVLRRIDTAHQDTARDAERQAMVHEMQEEVAQVVATIPDAERGAAAVQELGWMIEELRVNLFAQTLGTRYAISAKRIRRALNQVAEP